MKHPSRSRTLRTPLLAFAVALACAAPFAGPHTADATNAGKPAVLADTDRFIVKFRDGSPERNDPAARQRKLDAIGRQRGLRLGQVRRMALGADVVRSDRGLTQREAKSLVAALRADPRVEYAEVDARMQADLFPNDNEYNNQWEMGQSVGGMNAQQAWDTATGVGQVVAVVDTGITAHSDLAANLLPGYDFITDLTTAVDGDARDADPSDPGDWFTAGQCGANPARNSSWHGTHVAGTVAAVTNNSIGIAGVAFDAKVVPVRVLGKCGGFVSDIADGLIWASGGTVAGVPANANPADVINLSLGGSGACGATYQAAVDTAIANGSLVVVSAGNSNADAVNYRPANCVGVVTVAASSKLGGRSNYSNYGSAIEITAPGGEGSDGILSTLNTGTTTPVAETYVRYNGTSMAAPHVAGAAALVREASGGSLTPAEIGALLQATARSMPLPCIQGCGDGLLDAHAAVVAATTPVITVTDAAAADEGASGTSWRAFSVKLSEPLATAVNFNWETIDGTATAGSDYVAAGGSDTIPIGSTSTTVYVEVNGDTAPEGDEAFSVFFKDFTGPVTPIDDVATTLVLNDDTVALQNGVGVPVTDVTTNHNRYFTFDVPAGATNLRFNTSGGGGDADLYVRFGAAPTEATFDCRPYLAGNTEACAPAVQVGTWHVMLDAYEPYSTTVTAAYDIPVDVSIANMDVVEGDSGFQEMKFTVSLSQLNGSAVTFDAASTNGSAAAPDDFQALSTTGITIPAGSLSTQVIVNVWGDTTIENDESFTVDISNASAGATIIDGTATGIIKNNDQPALSVSDYSAVEGDSGQTWYEFTVSLSQAGLANVFFDVDANNGTAIAGQDFEPSGADNLMIPAGNTSTTFYVAVYGDTAIEADEAFTFDITNVVNASVADGSGAGTITNDDFPTISIGDATTVAEGNSGTKTMTFTVSLSTTSPVPVYFDATTYDGTAVSASDYVAGSVSDSIPAGQLSKTFSVTVNGDGAMERDEVLYVGLSNVTGAAAGDTLAQGTIGNDDGTIRINDPVAIFEGDSGTKVMTYIVELSQASSAPVTFNIATSTIGATATAGVDYVAKTQSGIVIPAGQTSKVVGVAINGDTDVESDETVRVNLSSGYVNISDNIAYGTIANDDGPKLSIADAGFQEGNSGTKILNFTVTLSQAATLPVSFTLQTSATGTASSSTDFAGVVPTVLSIPAGQTTRTFPVTIHGDTTVEGNETFFVWLSNASVAVTDAQARGMIVNDDGPVLSISDAQVTEGNSGTKQMTFTVSISQAAVAPVTFNLATINQSATGGVDYQGSNPTGVTIPTGQTSKTFNVVVNGDTTVEPNETLQVNLSMGNVSILDGIGIGTITNDD